MAMFTDRLFAKYSGGVNAIAELLEEACPSDKTFNAKQFVSDAMAGYNAIDKKLTERASANGQRQLESIQWSKIGNLPIAFQGALLIVRRMWVLVQMTEVKASFDSAWYNDTCKPWLNKKEV